MEHTTTYSHEVIKRIELVQSLSAQGHSTRWIANRLELDRQVVMALKKINPTTARAK